jgi:predicted transcriptional regulator
MEAKLLLRSKEVLSDGAILEMVIWQLPEPVLGSQHRYKYRLYYGVAGKRIVGFDNERAKGDHCHLDGTEKTYSFRDVDQLVDDFMRAIKERRTPKMTQAVIRIVNDDDAVLAAASHRFKNVWKSGKSVPVVFSFSSPAQLFSVISPKRWQLIERLQNLGPSTVRGLARALERDVKRVHEDVMALIEWGLVKRNDDGLVHVPFKVIHAEFDLKAVA